MTTGTGLTGLTMQGPTNPQQPATTQKPLTERELQQASRELRAAFGNNAGQEQIAARAAAAGARAAAAQAKAEAAAAMAQGDNGSAVIITPPVPPTPREFTIRGPDGRETIIGVPPHPFDNTIPPQVVDLAVAFFMTVAIIIIGLPLARAFARRMDRRGSAQASPEISSQLAHLNQAVDAIALEVERISEGQRFTTRLLSEERDAARSTLPSAVNR